MGDVIAFPRSPQQTAAEPRAPRRAVERVDEGHRPTAVDPRRLLWREALGHELREERRDQRRTQGDVAERAGISTQYLSEVERGRKEPSSEVLEAVTGALDLPLPDLVMRAARLLRPAVLTSTSPGPAQPVRPDGPVLLAG